MGTVYFERFMTNDALKPPVCDPLRGFGLRLFTYDGSGSSMGENAPSAWAMGVCFIPARLFFRYLGRVLLVSTKDD